MNAPARRLALLGGIVVVALLLAWLGWSRAERSEDDNALGTARSTEQGALPSFGTAASEAEAQPVATTPDSAAATTESGASAGATRLIVHVTWAADGSPAADIGLRFYGSAAVNPKLAPIPGRTDALGTWTFESPPVGKFSVVSDRGFTVAGIVKAGTTTELTLAIPAGSLVRGLVVNFDGRPIADAEVWLSQSESSWLGNVVARSGADGRFTLRDVSGRRWINAHAAGFVPSDLLELKRDLPAQLDLTLTLGGAGGELRGLVLDPAGRPVQDALVRVGPDGGWTRAEPKLHVGLQALDIHTDADGRFVAKDVPTGVVPVTAKHAGQSPWNTAIKVAPGGSYDLRIELKPGATLAGTARDDAGAPLADVTVSIGESAAQFDYVSAKTDETGRYELHDPPLGAQTVSAKKDGFGGASTTLAFLAGQTLGWDPQFSRGLQIVGRVTDESGASVARLRVLATHETATHETLDNWFGLAEVAADGRFSVPNCENVAHHLEVSDPRPNQPTLAMAAGVWPGPQEVRITIPADAHLAATLVGRFVEASGATPEGVRLYLAPIGSRMSVGAELDPATGAFSFENLSPGDYELGVWRGNSNKLLSVAVPALRGGERRDLGTLTLAAPGTIVVHVALPTGAESNAYVSLLSKSGIHDNDFKRSDGGPAVWTSGPLVPGDYTVSLYPGSGGSDTTFIIPVKAPARVEAGRETRLDLVAERGVAQNLHLQTQRTPPPAATVIVTDAAGAEVCHRAASWSLKDDGSGQEDWVSFITRPGACSLRVEAEGKLVVEQSITVPGGVNIGPDIEVVVP